jgi:uncharacterized phage protein gp47/JayE
MYEEYTYDNILSSMLADVTAGIDTAEGSFMHTALSRMALMVEEAFSELSNVNDNMEVDTQDLDHLITGGAECGCPIVDATPATLRAQFNCAVSVSDRFEAPDTDLTYYVIECLDDTEHIYSLESEDPGAEANSYIGEIEPIDYIEGFETGTILSVISAGTDIEDEEIYRERRMKFYTVKSFAGNIAYWREEIDALDGVGGCKPVRATAGGGHIDITIIGSDFKVPSAAVIAAVQQAAGPTTATADNEGLTPIGSGVTIYGCTAKTVNIAATLTFASGITYADVQSQVEAAIDAYFVELGQTWEASTEVLTVRKSQIEIRLLDISGITDVENIMLNSVDANLTLGTNELPVRGTITC